jgi:plastocyanin
MWTLGASDRGVPAQRRHDLLTRFIPGGHMFFVRLALITASIALFAACDSNNPVPPAAPSPSPSPAPSPAPAPGQTVAAVSIPTNAATLGNRAFAPAELNVTAGTTVTWTNTDTVTHTSSSDAQGWDSGAIAPNGQFSFAFPAAGTFPYHCAIHPGMVGRVVVR